MSPQQATDQARISHAGSSSPWGEKTTSGGEVIFEHGTPDSIKVALAQRGHAISPKIEAHGGYQAIWRLENPRRYFGGSDPRKDGAAIGY
jgi:gamma-glutamyltranspeptidase/glutathione hydrolase